MFNSNNTVSIILITDHIARNRPNCFHHAMLCVSVDAEYTMVRCLSICLSVSKQLNMHKLFSASTSATIPVLAYGTKFYGNIARGPRNGVSNVEGIIAIFDQYIALSCNKRAIVTT